MNKSNAQTDELDKNYKGGTGGHKGVMGQISVSLFDKE